MFYYPHDNKITRILKHLAFWTGLLLMFLFFVFLINDEAKIPQKEVILEIDMKNKVNICLPADDFPKEDFFDF